MPRQYQMSFEGSPYFRWVKMHKGSRYRVSCEDLGAKVFTKEATWQLANEWWRRKLLEINGATSGQDQPVASLTPEVIRSQKQTSGIEGTSEESTQTADWPSETRVVIREDIDSVNGVSPAVVLGNFTCEVQSKRFLEIEKLRGKAPGTFGDLAYYLGRILTDASPTLSPTLDVRAINETTVTGFYAWLRNSTQSAIVQKKLWGYFRRFIKFLWAEGLTVLPRNLDSRLFSFGTTTKKIKTYPVEEVREMLSSLPPRVKLYALLALNCGMYGQDISELKHQEYNDGRITRKRSKTKNQTGVPEVCYVLWPETRQLLESYPSTHPVYVLTSKTGTPLYDSRIEGDKRVKSDLIGQQFRRGRGEGRANKPLIPLKALRSISATLLESHPTYGRYKSHFLGHSPKSRADRHYSAPSQALFDEALPTWLRSQLLP